MKLEDIVANKARADARLMHALHHGESERTKHFWAGQESSQMMLTGLGTPFWMQWDRWTTLYCQAFVEAWDDCEADHTRKSK